MDITFGLFLLALVLSFPVFYIWGLMSFIRYLGRNNAAKRKEPDEASDTYNLLRAMRRAAAANPDLSLREFLADAGFAAPVDDTAAPAEAAQADPTPGYGYPSRAEAAQLEREPGFSWANWYRENTVNLLLYLGAFLIVAAVSLFVGFQWQNLGGLVRFGVVLVFTLGWYVGGFIVQRTLKLEGVSVAFITLGALLTPFCGVAWQQFVVGGPAGLGVTWLVTSLLSTGVYLGLSFLYRRRYFTYFGSLSILAMLLALVEINDAPAEYFILTGVLSALVLLLVRVALRFAPAGLRAYYERDFEYASLGTLLLSVVVGLFAIIERDIPFYSVEVLAVVTVTTVYAWVYASLRLGALTLAVAQVLTLFMVDHALATFAVPLTPRVVLGGGVHVGLLVLLSVWLSRRGDAPLYRRFSRVSVGVTALYAVGAVGTEAPFVGLLLALLLAAHAAYVAFVHTTAWMYHITAALAYLCAAYALAWVGVPEDYWLPVLALVAAGEVFIVYERRLPAPARRASARVGMVALALWLAAVPDMLDTIGSLTVIGGAVGYFVLGVYSAFAYAELTAPGRALSRWWHVLATGVGVVVYAGGAALVVDLPLYFAGHAALATVLAVLAYLGTRFAPLVSVAVVLPYMAVAHLLAAVNAPDAAYAPALALLSVALYLLDVALPTLPAESHTPRQYTVLGALATVATVAYASATVGEGQAGYIGGWVAGYALLGLLVYERDLWGERPRDYLIAAVALPLYFWHIEYLGRFVNPPLFTDVQWISAAIGTVALVLAWREIQRAAGAGLVNALVLVAAAFFVLPTLTQIGGTGLLVYFLLGVAYALGFVAFGVTLNRQLARGAGTVALVLVVLVQAQDFFFNLPRWLVVGLVGFGLIGAAVFLSVRRRATTEKGEG